MVDTKKPYVLITNDDGISSPGLHALVEALMPLCDLLVVAPKDQQTNMGRGALKGEDVGRIETCNLEVAGKSVRAYAVTGSPAQSVAHGVLELAESMPDYCMSGINYGENLGLAFTCSGTLGAAFEADAFGIPSVAFSRKIALKDQRSSDFSPLDWQTIIEHIRSLAAGIFRRGLPEGSHILNINFPDRVLKNTETRITRQAYMSYGQYVKPLERDFDKGHLLEWTINEGLNEVEKDTDIYALHVDGVISVTPLTSRMSVEVDLLNGLNEDESVW